MDTWRGPSTAEDGMPEACVYGIFSCNCAFFILLHLPPPLSLSREGSSGMRRAWIFRFFKKVELSSDQIFKTYCDCIEYGFVIWGRGGEKVGFTYLVAFTVVGFVTAVAVAIAIWCCFEEALKDAFL
jgi:hypothetical protein